jgi:hypothetical protein
MKHTRFCYMPASSSSNDRGAVLGTFVVVAVASLYLVTRSRRGRMDSTLVPASLPAGHKALIISESNGGGQLAAWAISNAPSAVVLPPTAAAGLTNANLVIVEDAARLVQEGLLATLLGALVAGGRLVVLGSGSEAVVNRLLLGGFVDARAAPGGIEGKKRSATASRLGWMRLFVYCVSCA